MNSTTRVPDRVRTRRRWSGWDLPSGSIPWLGFLAAILAVFVAYVRAAIKIAGAPQDYSGPMAKPHRMFVVTVTATCVRGCADFHADAWLNHDWGLTRDRAGDYQHRLPCHGRPTPAAGGQRPGGKDAMNAAAQAQAVWNSPRLRRAGCGADPGRPRAGTGHLSAGDPGPGPRRTAVGRVEEATSGNATTRGW